MIYTGFFKKAAFLLALTISVNAGAQARYLGQAKVAENGVKARNTYYWSIGTEVKGSGSVLPARQVLSTGVGQADFRLCTYEDGSPIFENGKYFFNSSSRLAGVVQTIYSYDINTCNITLVGTIQGYTDDGEVREPIAPHILYNRKDGWWYVFAHWNAPHHLCAGKTLRDPRFGYSEINFHQLDYSDVTKGDEDNFIYFDSALNKWVLVYSKGSDTISKQYSDRVDGGYELVCSNASVKSLTGINIVFIGGVRYLVSGFGWSPDKDAYKVFNLDDLSYRCDLNLDIPTGGFRGWGTIMAIPEGTETKYQLLTFDRINPTQVDNWQYGNIYLYEARERNQGFEYDLRRPEGMTIKASASNAIKPEDLHFVRKFSERFNYGQEIQMGRIDLSGRIFLDRGNPYPVMESKGVEYNQVGERIAVKGNGRFTLFGGTHLPKCEYVLDLSDMAAGEVRYLRIGTLEEARVEIRFAQKGGLTHISALGSEVLSVPASIKHMRILVDDCTAYFFDAD